ncbi:tetratricopeptide (TPR) repeat protein [Povalibacter uvarum]|uniref:Tetratricopeptide (TPR) repeat protein n=1 Tax=Povalibacter uvarum TaxID=732238 RepID=A0A841HRI3_9GAMM|nr:tetratricopeptide repeat protein [Povalibacter uvarum]MBB6095857.1 tetratricopeptide (TPR) repeat protein [Povalibacter uvarum]
MYPTAKPAFFTCWRHPIAAIAAAIVLAGCAGTPAQKTTDALPDDPNALVLGAEVALQRGQYLEASKAYVKAAQAANDETLAEQATKIAYEHHQWSLVLAGAERWLQLNQTNEEARRFAAFAALHLYQIDRAAEHLGFLLDTAFINPPAGFLALLPQLGDEGSAAAATAVLQKLVLKYPDLTEAHYALGRAALQSDNFALALEHAQKARELGPYWAPAGLLLAQVQLARGENDAALATAKTVVDHDSQDSYRLEYALMKLQAGRDEEGRKDLEALTAGDSGAIAERALADIDFQLGNRDVAATRYSNLVSNGRFVYESLFYLGAIAETRDATDEAIQIYTRVTGGDLAMAAQSRVARLKARKEGVDAGLKHLEEFASTRPQYTLDAITARAALLSSNGDATGAIALLDNALKTYPDSAELRFARVFQLEDADKVDEAVSALRQLVADRPGDPLASNALGYTLVDRTSKSREGLKLIEQALAQTPDNGAVLDSMGWALHRVKRNEEALTYLQHAKRRINDPEVDVHLYDVLLALGRKDEALELLKEASQRYPENEDLQARLKSLPN